MPNEDWRSLDEVWTGKCILQVWIYVFFSRCREKTFARVLHLCVLENIESVFDASSYGNPNTVDRFTISRRLRNEFFKILPGQLYSDATIGFSLGGLLDSRTHPISPHFQDMMGWIPWGAGLKRRRLMDDFHGHAVLRSSHKSEAFKEIYRFLQSRLRSSHVDSESPVKWFVLREIHGNGIYQKNHGLCHPTSPSCMRFFEVNMSQIYQFDMPCGIWYLSPPSPSPTHPLTHLASGSSTMRYCKSMWSKVDNNTTALNPLQIFCGQVLQDVGGLAIQWEQPSLKTNSNFSSENGWLEYEFPFGIASFQVRTVSFRKGSCLSKPMNDVERIHRVFDIHLEPQTTIYKWMFGETTIFYEYIYI